MKNSEQPINPVPYVSQDGSIQHDVFMGLTKREYFAGLAMQGILSNNLLEPNKSTVEYAAKLSISAADELLKQLEQ